VLPAAAEYITSGTQSSDQYERCEGGRADVPAPQFDTVWPLPAAHYNDVH
jgi:hypothetical protein